MHPVDPDDTLTHQRDEDIVKHNRTLQDQGSPVLLLAQLLADRPDLPAATYRIDYIDPTQLSICVQRGRLDELEAWRTALGLSGPEVHSFGESSWVAMAGRVQDVPVELSGHASEDEVAAYVAEHVAVAA
ncbi:hypothetical protein [Streptomyces arboris]|uniref:hypothetical protein n=1 Tax=Streptomyces arboris TaxID=2600619 RepID=UPI003BF50645